MSQTHPSTPLEQAPTARPRPRKRKTKGPAYAASPGAVLRTPLLPLATFTDWVDEAGGTDAPALRRVVARWLSDPRIVDALSIASPSLLEGIRYWHDDPDSPRGQSVESAVVRYLSRMSARCTPFGLFSGVSTVSIGDTTDLQLTGDEARHTRLDNEAMFRLVAGAQAEPELRETLTFEPNSSVYRIGERLRYAEVLHTDAGRRHRLVSADANAYVVHVLQVATAGATRRALASAVVEYDAELEHAEALAFVDELIDGQVLVPTLDVRLTGPEPLDGLLEDLPRQGAGAVLHDTLSDVREALHDLDAEGLGAAPSRYEAIADRLAELPCTLQRSRLFQVDLARGAEATVDRALTERILEAVEVMHGMSEGRRDEDLRRFRQAFVERYGDRDVPLMEALDEDTGIGFASSSALSDPSPLLEGLPFGGGGAASGVMLGRAQVHLLRRLHQHGAVPSVLELGPSDLEAMKPVSPAPPLPDAFETMVSLVGDPSDPTIVMHGGAWGPSGARTSGRFCHASPGIERGVRAHVQAEQALAPDKVFAEVVHVSEGRIGNIVARPVLRGYEIPFLGRSSAPRERQIRPGELSIRIAGERIVLWCARLEREVVPRLSAAHNFEARTLTVYRFLCALQHQGTTPCGFSWGGLDQLPTLPRVVLDNVVLARARWRLDADALAPIHAAIAGKPASPEQTRQRRTRVFEAMQRLRVERGLPRFLTVVDRDNKLPVDLDNPLSVYAAATSLKRRAEVVLEELFPGPDALVVHGPDGSHRHELTLAFVRSDGGSALPPMPPRPGTGSATRRFGPGSAWLYAKLSVGTSLQDAVLTDGLREVTERARERGDCDGWFFIRYRDNHPHLRVRWHGDPAALHGPLLADLHRVLEPWLESGAISQFQLDCYDRELERYGGSAGIELAERLFEVDSDAVLALLTDLEAVGGETARYRFAIVGVHALLTDFGLDESARLDLMTRMRDGFAAEFAVDSPFRKQLGQRFRTERGWMEDALSEGSGPVPWLERARSVLQARSRSLRPIVEALTCRIEDGSLPSSIERLLPSFVHMHCNRMLRSAPRHHELVIYDLLVRHYTSARAQRKSKDRPR